MPYCPKCRYEYKPTVEICPDCGKKLVTKLKQKKRKKVATLEISEEEALIKPKLKLLYVTRNLIYANFLKETLEKNGIPCLIQRESGVNLRGPALIRHPLTDTRVYVAEKNFEKSLKIKEQLVDNL
jgi:predicted amidophosphoribosyltransferase